MVITNLSATKSSEVGTGAEFFADVFGKRADVGAATDVTADFKSWIRIIEYFDAIDFNFATWDFEIGAFTSEFVGALAVNLDGRETRWGLGDFTQIQPFYVSDTGRSRPSLRGSRPHSRS